MRRKESLNTVCKSFHTFTAVMLNVLVAACGGSGTSDSGATTGGVTAASGGAHLATGGLTALSNSGGQESSSGGSTSTAGSSNAGGTSAVRTTLATPQCTSAADCDANLAVDLCKGQWACQSSTCVRDTQTVVSCSSIVAEECHDVLCMPATGGCEQVPTGQGRSCGKDYCTNGTCVPGTGQCKPTVSCTGCTTCDAAASACVPLAGWCRIAGNCVQVNASNPTNGCQFCDAASPSAWLPAPNGTPCTNVDACYTTFACDGTTTCKGDVPVAPGKPTPMRPISGTRTGSLWASQERNTLRPLFAWSAAALDSCPTVTYDLQVDDSCSPSSTCAFASPEIDLTGLKSASYRAEFDLKVESTPPVGRRYYWRVRACRGIACSDWSSSRYVDVGRAPHDYNGDGYSDLAVNAFSGGQTFVYFGSATGVAATAVPVAADRTVRNGTTGDVNADGYSDLLVFSYHSNLTPHGRLNAYLGSASGLPASPQWTISRSADDYQPVFASADFEGDGYDDLVANAGNGTTMADCFKGTASGLPTTISSWLAHVGGRGNTMNIHRMGSGDFNGDAVADLVGNAYAMVETIIYVSLIDQPNSPPGLPSLPTATLGGITTNTADDPCIGVVDRNGDNRHDLVLGLNGSLYTFTAQATGFASTPNLVLANLFPIADNYGADCLGGSLIPQNTDLDLVVIAPSTSVGGTLYLYSAGVAQNAESLKLTNPAGVNDWYFGDPIQVPGDINGDGNDDLVVCDFPYATGTGQALVYYGPLTADAASRVVSSPSANLSFCINLF